MELKPLDFENLKYSLFLKRRFLPIFLATFLGSFNDNLLRSGLIVMLAYSAIKGIMLPTSPEIMVTICSALLVLPILTFSSIAGPVADKYEKSRLVRITKLIEIFIMAAAWYGFKTQNIYLLMVTLFISGTHTTFYSPIKFSILPDHLKDGELLAGNGFQASATYLAVLFGLIAGGLLEEIPGDAIGFTALGVAAAGFIASLFVPRSSQSHPETPIHFNIIKGTRDIIAYAYRNKTILFSTLALSWFLLISSVYMSQFANYAQSVVHANNEVYILFLTIFSIGIAIGSVGCDLLLKGEITVRLTPIAGFGISLFTYAMVVTTPVPRHAQLIDVGTFLSNAQYWPLLICMLLVAVCGGLYIVPLYAMLQSKADVKYRSRVMAASNLSDAVFVTLAALISAGLLALGLRILDLFIILASLNLVMVWYCRKIIRRMEF